VLLFTLITLYSLANMHMYQVEAVELAVFGPFSLPLKRYSLHFLIDVVTNDVNKRMEGVLWSR
jgi:hypothetical protein